jgi:type IV secretory pathway VirB2 component (pilin)
MQIVTGNAGKAFAAFAILSVGIGFFTGKVSWGLMIGVVAGIAAMFGAPSIVSAITGKSSFNCDLG